MNNKAITEPKITLVTGASGFVGANLVHKLVERGDLVHVVVRPTSNLWRLESVLQDINVHKSDIADANTVKEIVSSVKPERVFHLVHYGGNGDQKDEAEVRRVVRDGSVALYDACMDVGTVGVLVNVGSSSEYGLKNEPMREDMSTEPITPYGKEKLWVTKHGQKLSEANKLNVVTARLFSVYGNYELRKRFMTEVTLACLRGEDPVLTDPKTARDFIFIEDVVDALALLGESGEPGEIYNVGTGVESTLGDATDLIVKYTGFKKDLKWGTMEGRSFDTTSWQADMSHTNDSLGWKAEHSLEEGIKKTVEWFKENMHLYDNL